MLNIPKNKRYFVFQQNTDMRSGFDVLHGIVNHFFQQDIRTGDLFFFFNKNKNRMKILSWDHDGMAIFYKRLEKGTFSPKNQLNPNYSYTEILLLIEGLELQKYKKKARY